MALPPPHSLFLPAAAQVQANATGAQDPGDPWFYSLGDGTATMPYQLPDGLTCDGTTTRCVMQWNYQTGAKGTGAPWCRALPPPVPGKF